MKMGQDSYVTLLLVKFMNENIVFELIMNVKRKFIRTNCKVSMKFKVKIINFSYFIAK